MLRSQETGPCFAEPPGVRQRLAVLREALLHLHKTLLEFERASYEATFGQIASPYQFLHLAMNDPWFVWLKPVTQLIASVDELLEAPAPLSADRVEKLIQQAGSLLVATMDGEGFSRHYDEAMQRSPDVVFAHAAAASVFRSKK